MNDINKVTELTRRYNNLTHLECDGLTRVLHTVLTDANVGHLVCLGKVSYSGHLPDERSLVEPHLWIELGSDSEGLLVVDYRLRMWLGDYPTVPHGVFNPVEYEPIVEYHGEPIALPLLNKAVFLFMTDPA